MEREEKKEEDDKGRKVKRRVIKRGEEGDKEKEEIREASGRS